MSSKITRACLASGFLVALLFGLGFVVLAGFLPPPPPTLAPIEVAEFYQQHPTATLIGAFFIMTAMGMLAPWGCALAASLRHAETGVPVLTYLQLVNCAISTMVVVFCPMFWAAAAYRPFDTSPEIIRVMNDIGWFLVLAPWPPFSFWLAAVGCSVLSDRQSVRLYPAWTAYLSFWCAVLFVPAGAVLIFKTGPFAWNGIIAFYIPVVAFFAWLMIMSFYGSRSRASPAPQAHAAR